MTTNELFDGSDLALRKGDVFILGPEPLLTTIQL
jgi:hypothetical protein